MTTLADLLLYGDRFGPDRPTPRTRAGLPEGEVRSAVLPTPMERALDIGAMPAKLATEVAMQPVRAGEAVGEALSDPSLANVTNAGVQTAFAVAKPMHALKALGAGYTAAAAKDAGLFGSPAEAGGLSPEQNKRKAELQKRIEKAAWKSSAERRAVEAELADLREIEKEFALGANKGQREEYDRQTAEAQALAKKARARDTRYSDSTLKEVYEKTGGPIPLAAGVAGVVGALHRAAPARQKWLEGTGAAFTVNNAPMGYDAIMSPAVNPEYEAVTALAQNLPDEHPQKQKYIDLSERMRATGQDRNPVNTAAWDQFTDPVLMAKRLGMSGVEGLTALIGAQAPNAVKGVASVPGLIREGNQLAQKGAATAKIERYAAEAEAQAKRGLAAEARATADEVARRSSGQAAGAAQAGAAAKPVVPPAPPPANPQPGTAVVANPPAPPPPVPANAGTVKANSPPRKTVTKEDTDQILRNLVSGKPAGEGLAGYSTEAIAERADYLQKLAGSLGAPIEKLLDAGKLKKGPWSIAVGGSVGAGAALEDDTSPTGYRDESGRFAKSKSLDDAIDKAMGGRQ